MADTPNLNLPYIMPAQAQKHVTHNEAIRALDAIVQIAVLDRDLAAPPVSPAEGDRYIVAAGATGDWASHEGDIAAYQDGAWLFYVASEGWLAWVADEDLLVAWDGAAWVTAGGGVNPTPLVGINTTADTTNRLSLSAPASLFSHEGAGHQIKLNKNAPADTGSVLFQTAFSGRSELGLAGDDDLHVKVSPDGATWYEALVVDKDTGEVSFPNSTIGPGGAPGGADTQVQFNDGGAFAGASGLFWDETNGRLGVGAAAPGAQVEITKDLRLPATADANTGVVYMGTARFVHAYGLHNLFVGAFAGNFTLTGTDNLGVGQNALGSLTSGQKNTALNYRALLACTTGSFNFALGYRSLQALTTGGQNVGIGSDTLVEITTQSNNIAIGHAVMWQCEGAVDTVAIGSGAMFNGSAPTRLVAIGTNAASQTGVTSAQDDVVIGYRAGYALTSGSDNVLVGSNAGNSVTTGSGNTAIGNDTGQGITTGSNNTIIGANVTGLSASLANNVILADGAGNIRVQIDGSGHAAFAGAVKPKSYTVATLPSASGLGAGAMVFVTDETGGAVPAFSDGTDWRRMTDRAVVS